MCRCNDTMDIRARCCFVNARKAFQTCPARIDTALFQLQNDAETDKLVYSAKNRRNATKYVREFLLKKIKLTRPDANKVIGLYWEEKDEEARVEKEEKQECVVCYSMKNPSSDPKNHKCSRCKSYICGQCLVNDCITNRRKFVCSDSKYEYHLECFVCKKGFKSGGEIDEW